MKLVFPDADIPIVQVSLKSSLDPAFHFKLGELLGRFREEGVLIVGSGQATHNMYADRGGRGGSHPWASQFVEWLTDTVTVKSKDEAKEGLVKWKEAPGAKSAHPREEHLVPIMVAAGAALGSGSDKAEAIYVGKGLPKVFAGHFSLASFMWD